MAEINSAPKLTMIPVVIMTTSAVDEEILKSYALLARATFLSLSILVKSLSW